MLIKTLLLNINYILLIILNKIIFLTHIQNYLVNYLCDKVFLGLFLLSSCIYSLFFSIEKRDEEQGKKETCRESKADTVLEALGPLSIRKGVGDSA